MCSCVDHVSTCVQYLCVHACPYSTLCAEVFFYACVWVCGYSKRRLIQDDLSIQLSLTIRYLMYINWSHVAKVMHQNRGRWAQGLTGIAALIAHWLLSPSAPSFTWHRRTTKSESECEQYLHPAEFASACVIVPTVITVCVGSRAHVWLWTCTCVCQRGTCIRVWLEMT